MSASTPQVRPADKSHAALAVALVGVGVLIVHLALNGRYGYHRDELYYLACGRHPAWGYVDHPPLTPRIARLSETLFPGSLRSLRLLPACAHAGLVLLTGTMARTLGAGRFGQILAAVCVAVAPLYLSSGNLLQPVVFDQLFWALAFFTLLILFKTGNQRLWPVVGLIVGTGLLNKHTLLFFAFGLFVGLLVSGQDARRHLRSGWFWLAAAIALAFLTPNLFWQAQHDWPSVEFLRALNARVRGETFPGSILVWQIPLLHPATLPVWIAGLQFLLRGRAGNAFRPVGWVFVSTLVLLLAAGAVVVETRVWRGAVRRRRQTAALLIGTLLAFGLLSAPLVLPLVPPRALERSGVLAVNKDFAEMFGWPELAAAVAGVYHDLPPAEQKRCVLLAANYGEAGALERFGAAYDLPPKRVVSGHNSYFLWGPGEADRDVAVCIAVGYSEKTLRTFFADVRPVPAAALTNPHNIPNDEQGMPVTVCRPRAPRAELWPRLKHYN